MEGVERAGFARIPAVRRRGGNLERRRSGARECGSGSRAARARAGDEPGVSRPFAALRRRVPTSCAVRGRTGAQAHGSAGGRGRRGARRVHASASRPVEAPRPGGGAALAQAHHRAARTALAQEALGLELVPRNGGGRREGADRRLGKPRGPRDGLARLPGAGKNAARRASGLPPRRPGPFACAKARGSDLLRLGRKSEWWKKASLACSWS